MTVFGRAAAGEEGDMVEPTEAPRRHLSARQADLVDRLMAAAAEEVEEGSYDGITVRSIARRAGVSPASAYTYFSSKDHLLAEVLWRRTRELPPPLVDLNRPAADRVADVVRHLGLGTVDSPAVVAACTTALLSNSPDVKRIREHIGGEIHRRLLAALGPDTDPTVLRVLETTYVGAMLGAGLGHLEFDELPDRLREAAELMIGER
ncbi:MAG TPA: TetR/AcrR family transcriptional regulator [Acidimicrobiales bacterium]|nr:TetR/AcrR family transcriptional regulator [Acidimicrobiales bacterium]